MKSKYFINAILLVLVIFLFLLLFEVILRVVYPQPVLLRSHIEASPQIFQEGKNIPWELKPLVDTRHLGIFGEWNVSIKTNIFGLRDKDYNLESNSNKILFLGDSFTFGYGVEQEESYSEIFEKLIDYNYIVINSGYADGYSPDTFYVYLKDKGLDFNPDLVILGFFIGNDIIDLESNEWVELDEKELPKKVISNKVYIDEKNRMRIKGDENVINNSPYPNLYKINLFLSYHSHVYVFLKDRLKFLFYILTKQNISLDKTIYGNYYDKNLNLLLDKDEKILFEMNSLLNETNKKFVIVLIPSIDQFNEEKDDSYDFSNPNKRLLKFGKENNITVIDLFPYFENNKPNKLYFSKDGHWNARGHKFAAEIIYNDLKNMSLI